MMKPFLALVAAVGISSALLTTVPAAAEHAVAIPAPAHDLPASGGLQQAVLAGGCFWGMEAVFEHVKGVRAVTAGYDGGTKATANYPDVSSERTGHAEAIRITYDPHQVSYGTLLRIFFSAAHDPTQVNRQTPDTGPSYRSAIFAQNKAQAQIAAAYIRQLNASHAFDKPIATKIEQGTFYPAESYHQDFYDKNPNYPYIVRWDKPRVAAFKKAFPNLVKG